MLLLLIGGVGSLAKLELLGELSRQDAQVLDQSLGGVNDSLTRSDLTISLDTQLELGGERVRDLMDCC